MFGVCPELLGGSADLTGSNLTLAKGSEDFTPENRAESARLPDITVTNRLGTHAMVSRTADPNIVVVWLSAEPNRRNP